MNSRDEGEFERQPGVELVDHARAVARRDHGQAGHRDLVAGMLCARTASSRLFELFDDRQQIAPNPCRARGPSDHRLPILRHEAPHQESAAADRHIASASRRRACRASRRASGARSRATRRCRPPAVARDLRALGDRPRASAANRASAPAGNSMSTSIGLAPVKLGVEAARSPRPPARWSGAWSARR